MKEARGNIIALLFHSPVPDFLFVLTHGGGLFLS